MNKEQRFLRFLDLLSSSQIKALEGKPNKVIELIDNYDKQADEKLYMNIGKEQGQFLVEQIRKSSPKSMIELGGYLGYSAILFGNELATHNGKYFSFELSPEYAEISRKLIDLAGLSDVVTVVVGATKTTLPQLPELMLQNGLELNSGRLIDFILLDHEKSLYVPDFRMMESLNYIGIGTVIAADNILMPSAYGFHEYMALTPQQKHVFNGDENVEGKRYVGRWNMVYETEMVEFGGDGRDGGRDGVELSRCVNYFDA